ncbi:MAG: zinc ribbon domain-containing protein [Bacilli bacterium]|nr:zinc ribbon domain-containing protein [Bacilli bacterium]
MYCSKCGKKIADDAAFCDGCGAKVGGEEKKERSSKEGKVHKCPYCGEILPFDALKCPSCGKEIRGREVAMSVQSFFDKINLIEDDDRKIEFIKTFPIPNNREDILEFMFLATSNFDAKYYATNRNKESLPSAWLSKIEQCYQKGKIMLTSKSDLARLEDLYAKAKGDTKKVVKIKLILIILGFMGIAAGTAVLLIFGENNTILGGVGIAVAAAGVVSLIFGFKRKKTNKEIAQEKIEKEKRQQQKAIAKGKALPEQKVIHETVVTHVYEESPKPAKEEDVVIENKVPKQEETGPVTYPDEEVEIVNYFAPRRNEKIIFRRNVDSINGDEDHLYNVVLSTQALYYVKMNDDEQTVDEVTRIPLGKISQAIYEYGEYFTEVYREGAVDRIDGDRRLEILALAINDRFKKETSSRDFDFYKNLKSAK